MPKITKILLLVVSVVLVLTVFLGVNSSGVSAASEPQDGAYRQINVYSEVLRHIQTDYVEEPNINAVTNGALRGLLESLDADSSYLTPEDYKTYKAGKGGKAQVGINVSKRYGYATVVSVVPGSPADKANLNDGDIIEAINGQDTRDISLAMIQLLLEGQPGSELTVSVVRPRKATPEKISMTRVASILPPVSETMYENSSILYLKPGVLDHEHVQQVEAKLKAMPKAGNKKVLLDLRDVAAGDMAEATRLANFFLKSGTIAMLEGQKVDKQTFTADASKSINATSPVVVLVNRGTAGPGELVAAALLDNKRADLVGEKTFGEGAQQKTFELPDGAALILSVAKYESPSGKKIQDEGVTPGMLVASNTDDGASADDEAADDQASTIQHDQTAPQKPSVTVDDQLTKALDLLKSKAA
ncbi:MAG TPA: S41 family peptidase [Edaphobacter sp.]|nr:S41 family peptidase [Edaphobacter sp.]